jgi:peptidoglycan/xylan/chitin deacetylase (PgdA/CDA1 family)
VITYHRVLPRLVAAGFAVEPGMFVTPATFRRHLRWLERGFRVLPLTEIVQRIAEGRSLPRGACAITFDDGWRDNFDHAWPALAERGLPATIFLVTERVGTQGAFWPDEVARRLRELGAPQRGELARRLRLPERTRLPAPIIEGLKALAEVERERLLDELRRAAPREDARDREILSWEEVERMARGGIDFESHGSEHLILTRVPRERAEADLLRARTTLRERGLGRHGLLAYPNGAFDARIVDLARRCGHRAAFTLQAGLVASNGEPLAFPRIGLHEDVSAHSAEFHRAVPGSALRAAS